MLFFNTRDVKMISERIKQMREMCRCGYYHRFRKMGFDFSGIASAIEPMDAAAAEAYALKAVLDMETPIIIKGERLQFTRSIGQVIPKFFPKRIVSDAGCTRAWPMGNSNPDYRIILQEGIEKRISRIKQQLVKYAPGSGEYAFLSGILSSLNCIIEFSDRYAAAAEELGEPELAALLKTVPRRPAATLQEALQSVYFTSAMFRLAGYSHIGFGRTDQYLIDFYRGDLASGRETPESARELIAEFFLALCRDYDIFPGVQTGDNGQSMIVGGCKRDGSSAENELTTLLMDISADLKMIDPKINLRLDRNTSQECLLSAAMLSGCGLGFPQYNNDEVIIPGLVNFGYKLEDARDYTVAACWEFVVKNGNELPNIDALNLAYTADIAIRKMLKDELPFESIRNELKTAMRQTLAGRMENWKKIYIAPGPLFSAFEDVAVESAKDIATQAGYHHHIGVHGCGSSTAADSIAAVKRFVYDEKSVTPQELLAALENNFEGFEELQKKLRECDAKVGCSDPDADNALQLVFDTFAEVLGEVKDNGYGGKLRPGSGSAMYYVWFTRHSDNEQYLKATADGRKEREYISSSLAPAPGVKPDGMLSVLKSYSKIDYNKICNGGPITMEFDPHCFSSGQAITKMTALIRGFVNSGCQQLQWNILDPDVLRHAKKYPEQHRDLVVRVWGWSGFFVELDEVFQDQIIARHSFNG